jgi:hypothetical protein
MMQVRRLLKSYLLRLPELRFEADAELLGLQLLGDVDHHPQHTDDFALEVAHRLHHHPEVAPHEHVVESDSLAAQRPA